METNIVRTILDTVLESSKETDYVGWLGEYFAEDEDGLIHTTKDLMQWVRAIGRAKYVISQTGGRGNGWLSTRNGIVSNRERQILCVWDSKSGFGMESVNLRDLSVVSFVQVFHSDINQIPEDWRGSFEPMAEGTRFCIHPIWEMP